MAAPTLVDRRIDHGERLLTALDWAGTPIESAFWLYTSEWDEWRLVLATPLVDLFGPIEAYRRVQAAYHLHPEISFRLQSVTVVGTDDRRVQELRAAFTSWPPILGNRLEDRFIQTRLVEGAYAYRLSPPPPLAAARGLGIRSHVPT